VASLEASLRVWWAVDRDTWLVDAADAATLRVAPAQARSFLGAPDYAGVDRGGLLAATTTALDVITLPVALPDLRRPDFLAFWPATVLADANELARSAWETVANALRIDPVLGEEALEVRLFALL